MNQVDLELGMLRIWGKGNKERLVPMPKADDKIVREYVDTVRPLYQKTDVLAVYYTTGQENDYCFHRKYDKISVYPGRNSEADHAA